MEDNTINNKIQEEVAAEVIEFKYNFINTPWDDRSNKSKFGIVTLLVAIFVAIMGLVINNFFMHYSNYGEAKVINATELNCLRVRIWEYPYVARIHSIATKELLCVGAVVSRTSVLASGLCVKSGPIRLHLGAPNSPLCKKGFTVDVIETVYHDGVISKKLALLSSYDYIAKCSSPVTIGKNIYFNAMVHIIGRPINFGWSLSRQHANVVRNDCLPDGFSIKNLKTESMICVKVLSRCPIRAGDLLVQSGNLFGVSATSVHRSSDKNIVCFANLSLVFNELKELDEEIRYTAISIPNATYEISNLKYLGCQQS